MAAAGHATTNGKAGIGGAGGLLGLSWTDRISWPVTLANPVSQIKGYDGGTFCLSRPLASCSSRASWRAWP
jgi:hypothetical protein